MEQLTFCRLRKYISRIDRLSICNARTSRYENFICIEDVPKKYDRYYVTGIGLIESEFYKNDTPLYAATGELKDRVLLPCLEIRLSRNKK